MFQLSLKRKFAYPTITIVGFYATPEDESEVQRQYTQRHFAAVGYAYGLAIQIVESPDQIILDRRPIVCVEERRSATEIIDLGSFDHPQDAIYVFGNSDYRYPGDWLPCQSRVCIDTPMTNHPLYGNQAAAIVLYDRFTRKLTT